MATDALIIWDILSIAASGYLCALLYLHVLGRTVSATFVDDARSMSLMGGLLSAFVLRHARATGARETKGYYTLAAATRGTIWRVIVLFGLLLAVMFLTRIETRVPRLWMLMWAASTLAVSLGGRIALCVQLSALEARGVVRERVAVVGSGPAAMRLLARLKRERGRAIEFVGLFDDGAEPSADGVVSDCARLVELGQSNEVDWVIVAMSRPGGDHLHRIVHELKALDVQVALCPEVLETELPNAQIGHFGSLPMMLLVNRPIRKWGLLIKELIDKVVSAAMIVALLPLLLAIAAAIRLDSPGPVIFRQRRHGRNNTEFEVFKFRSMRVATGQASDGRIQAQRNDRRITRIGAFLRKTSLDELPQLFNVLRGDMSLVGPRPHPCEMRTENLLSAEIMAEYAHRHRVKPGITGWAQIRGHRGATETAEQVRSRVECDLFYIENWSLMLDLKILALTPVKLVFDRSNAF